MDTGTGPSVIVCPSRGRVDENHQDITCLFTIFIRAGLVKLSSSY